MKEPKKFKSNKLTSVYGFNIGLEQIATATGLSHKDFSEIKGNKFEKQSNVVMMLMNKLFIVESFIYSDNGTVARTSATYCIHKEAQFEFNRIKKLNKLKLVDQTALDSNQAA